MQLHCVCVCGSVGGWEGVIKWASERERECVCVCEKACDNVHVFSWQSLEVV